MGYMCNKCTKLCGVIILIVGILFLVRDLSGWAFWNIQWYTVVFILWGIGGLASLNCKECQAVKSAMMGKKK